MGIHVYTPEEKEFMERYVPGHSYAEIREAFSKRFGWEISISQVNGYIGNHGLNTGRDGRFPKGCVPMNKGRKGECAAGCEKGWFPKGHVPVNHRPVGSERLTKDGYIMVKTEEPNKWRLKQRVVWEKANGDIPKDHAIIFLDNDRTNTDISNLRLVGRDVLRVMNMDGLQQYTGEYKETAVDIAKLQVAIYRGRRRKGGNE